MSTSDTPGWMLKVKRNWNVHRKLLTLLRSKMINDYFAFSSTPLLQLGTLITEGAITLKYMRELLLCGYIRMDIYTYIYVCMFVITMVFNSWLYDQQSLEPYVLPVRSRCHITTSSGVKAPNSWSKQDGIVVIYYFLDGTKP